ncbi:hypothetical protein K435DRAFT_857497 [Dendrothele bispora CBS 962.96]|uniref:Uncharacterized protein n=1 Tax=Dendrothele bispora (strain CBS 962.96) TaxID=1314807 RepID=A0A4S8M693_DENBC|nr:hypothetical protein K435DRAFT_857497 [Dendrothele bispora CBS 962.96]
MPARATRSTRASLPKTPSKQSISKQSKSKSTKTSRNSKKRNAEELDQEDDVPAEDDDDAYDEEAKGKKEKEYDSDALDDDTDFEDADSGKKRKRKATSKKSPRKSANKAPRKRRRLEEVEAGEEGGVELKDGQEIVGEVVQAPKSGRVPPGQISQNTLDFLFQLTKPDCNDREWFKLHEPVYRLAEKEWKDFVEHFTEALIEVDPHIPPLPPKDVIHRIYRDIRFSNDKTPYKRSFSASLSRSGRKGIFAGSGPIGSNISVFSSRHNSCIRPGGQNFIAAGSWCPGKNELATIRSNILRSSRRLRQVISAPDFVKFFGPSKPKGNGERQNIFGMEDELKVAPKGVDKDHKDIDLLKCRSFVVIHYFLDSEVTSPDFQEKLIEVAGVMRPFVHCLNDLMTLRDDNEEDEADEEEDEEEQGESDRDNA